MIFSHSFLSGTCFGLMLAVLMTYLAKITVNSSGESYYQFLSIYGKQTTQPEVDFNTSFENISYATPTQLTSVFKGKSKLSVAIKDSIRVVCWVMTQPKNHHHLSLTVRATWGKRCTKFFYVSTTPVTFPSNYNRSAEPTDLPPLITAVYQANESRDILWNKTLTGFQYAYEQFFDDGDWFLKADDDTYVIMENLRLMLLDKNPSEPVFYGCKFIKHVPTGYNSGGAGYVLSKEALKRFIERPSTADCPPNGAEDVSMGKCLSSVGAFAGDSRDSDGKQRFFALPPLDIVYSNITSDLGWYWEYMAYKHSKGVDCCSDSVVSFHYINEQTHWLLEYLIYHVHPFGVHPLPSETQVKRQLQTYLTHKNAVNITKSIL